MNRDRRYFTVALLAAVGMSLIEPAPVMAQDADAGYTAAQALDGAAIYADRCAGCHLAGLQGAFEAPELTGANFRNTWAARPVAQLMDLIAATMPPEDRGSHSPVLAPSGST